MAELVGGLRLEVGLVLMRHPFSQMCGMMGVHMARAVADAAAIVEKLGIVVTRYAMRADRLCRYVGWSHRHLSSKQLHDWVLS